MKHFTLKVQIAPRNQELSQGDVKKAVEAALTGSTQLQGSVFSVGKFVERKDAQEG